MENKNIKFAWLPTKVELEDQKQTIIFLRKYKEVKIIEENLVKLENGIYALRPTVTIKKYFF